MELSKMKAHITLDVAQWVKSLFRVGLVSQFIAVTGGVALGLFADNWREDRVERSREQAVLEALPSDLQADRKNLEALSTRMDNWDKGGLWTYQNRGADIASDSVMQVLSNLIFYTPYEPQRTAFEATAEAGDIGLIYDLELRQGIVDYFASLQPGATRFFDQMIDRGYWGLRAALDPHYTRGWPEDALHSRDRISFELQEPWSRLSRRYEVSYSIEESGMFAATMNRNYVEPMLAANVALDGLIQDILQTRAATPVNAGSPNGS
jgi:hypothetical protein